MIPTPDINKKSKPFSLKILGFETMITIRSLFNKKGHYGTKQTHLLNNDSIVVVITILCVCNYLLLITFKLTSMGYATVCTTA